MQTYIKTHKDLYIYIKESDHTRKQKLVVNVRKNNAAIKIFKPTVGYHFIFKHRMQKINMNAKTFIGYSYESKIFFFKVNTFNQLLICLRWSTKTFPIILMFWKKIKKYENHDIQRFEYWWMVLPHISYKICFPTWSFLCVCVYIYI